MTETVQRDQYGNLILPGYRQPFQKGYDPRRGKGPKIGFKFVTIAQASRLILKMERIIDELRVGGKSPKRGSRVVLQKSGHGKNVGKNPPLSSVISPTVQPSSRSAPTVKPATPISPCSIRQSENPPPVDDYDGLF